MRKGLSVLVALCLAGTGRPQTDQPPVGFDAVKALLIACSDANVIVFDPDPKTGKVPKDPKLGLERFTVPDESRLLVTVQANRSLMENVKSRHFLIGLAKTAAPGFASGWIDLLRAVGRAHHDEVCIKIAYNIAATHDLPPGSKQGFADLKTLVNKALEKGALSTTRAGRQPWPD